LLERWGIAQSIGPSLVQAPPGVPVGTLIARGDVELGFQQLAELVHLPGIDIVGLLPREAELVTTFCAAVCSRSAHPDGAKRFLALVASADDSVKRRHGMEPV
jgi:molybdate transport system substrate-binding protein